MKCGMMYANAGPLGFPETLGAVAEAAERVGLESLWTVEHVVIPVGYRSTYPYHPSGRIQAPESLPIPDPLLALAWVAARTRTIRLATGILILPQRHPLYVAKEVATLDVLSHGRVILGVGVGWLEEEFDALGIPFAERGARTAETVRAVRALWRDEPEPFAGRFFRWGKLESQPKPVQKPGVPIVVGGHTELAARRAARWGDGFFPGVADDGRLPELLAVLREECTRVGRDAAAVEVTAGRERPTLDDVRRLQDLGVSRLVIAPPAFDAEGVARGLERFADEVLARC